MSPLVAAPAGELESLLAELATVCDEVYPAVTRHDPRLGVFTRSNAAEIFPGVTTPATWGSVGLGLERAFLRAHAALGVVTGRAGPDPRFIGLFYGRVALCLSAHGQVNRRGVGAPWWPFNQAALARGGVDSAAYAPPGDLGTWLADLVWRLWSLPRVRRVEVELPGRVDRLAGELDRLAAESARLDIVGASLDELVVRLEGSSIGAEILETHLQVTFFAGGYYALLERLVRSWTGLDPVATTTGLLTGIGSLESAGAAEAIAALAAAVREAPRLAGLLADGDLAGFAAAVEEPADNREAAVALARRSVLESHGHRSIAEAEIDSRTWREDPAQVDRLVVAHLRVGAGEASGSPGARREALEADVARSLAPARRRRLLRAAAGARRFAALRERTKSLTVRNGAKNKALSRELARRLVEKSILAQPRDVTLLTRDEVVGLARGQVEGGDARARVARRARAMAICARLELGDETFTAPPVPRLRGDAVEIGPAPPREAHGLLVGMGVSPGRAEGTVRVVADPRAESSLQPGEILVAPYTDAAWAPLFMLAAGIVVDTGGMISHGAIVARELGLPAVVNVPGTARLRTGDRVVVDGGQGTVELVASAPAAVVEAR